MPIVKMFNRKTGITYVYESESYWDREKQQPRNRRKLIGKIDPETGEIVPTGRSGRRKAAAEDAPQGPAAVADAPVRDGMASVLDAKDAEIAGLRRRVRELEAECEHYGILIDRIRGIIGGR